ncbi:MAG: hypothetical protein DRJ42_16825 [Deltaproteobacteria bacterium]|nr:MAG: hypothetical protein DRJ42_16825 [Deltaproteobacteria bacterium]
MGHASVAICGRALLGVVLCCASTGCAESCGLDEAPETLEAPETPIARDDEPRAGALLRVHGCDFWGERARHFVRVTDDAWCVESNAGDRECIQDWAELVRALHRVKVLIPNDEMILVPETDDPGRIAAARGALDRAGMGSPKVCTAYTQIWERRDGTYDYPRNVDGSDHACADQEWLYQPPTAPGANIERWCRFDDGVRSGLMATFDAETGNPISVGSYRSGLAHFQWLYFDPSGAVSRSQWYADGEPNDFFPAAGAGGAAASLADAVAVIFRAREATKAGDFAGLRALLAERVRFASHCDEPEIDEVLERADVIAALQTRPCMRVVLETIDDGACTMGQPERVECNPSEYAEGYYPYVELATEGGDGAFRITAISVRRVYR